MTIISNAFSLNMIQSKNPGNTTTLKIQALNLEQAQEIARSGLKSAVGHADTAAVLSNMLGVNVQPNRVNVSLTNEEPLLVGQYIGPRLPEGATELPEGARIEFFLVSVE